MLDVSRDQLLRSFRKLRVAQTTLTTDHAGVAEAAALLKFYAAEVGLKYRFLAKNNRHRATQLLDVSGKSFGHDLDRLVAAIAMPRSVAPMPNFVRAPRAGTVEEATVKIGDVHQAWRYGRDIVETDQRAMQDWLECILNYLEQNL